MMVKSNQNQLTFIHLGYAVELIQPFYLILSSNVFCGTFPVSEMDGLGCTTFQILCDTGYFFIVNQI